MNKLANYKDSGIEWMGKIPNDWNLIRMRYLCDIETGDKDTENREEDGEYPFFVRSQTIERISTYTFDGEAILTAGDGVGVCKVWHYINGKFDCHQRVYRLSNFRKVNGKFLFYFLRENFIKEVLKLSAKSTVDSLRMPMFQDFRVAFGPFEEQLAIVEFLDRKTSQIDTLISEKEKLIELLQEEHTTIINQAVTKGLDLKVPMKESGIEWLGEIPRHWALKKLKYVGRCQNGVSGDATYFGSGHPFVSYSDVYKNDILPAQPSGLANSSEKDREVYSVKEGDVFFTRTSETIEEIGLASTCINTINDAVFAGFLIRFRPDNAMMHKGFSRYFFRCQAQRIFLIKEMNLVTRASLSQELLKRMPVLIPPYEEQIQIAEFLDSVNKRFLHRIQKIKNEVGLLCEYRSALISEAVTGKIDVRQESLIES